MAKYRAVEEAGRLADKQLATLRAALGAKKATHPDIRGLESALAIIKLSKTLDEARERVAQHIIDLRE